MDPQDEAALRLLHWRGIDFIEDACVVCGGSGVRVYPSTAGPFGGVGGQAMTTSVCNACWGSGHTSKPWPSWIKMREESQKAQDLRSVAEGLVQASKDRDQRIATLEAQLKAARAAIKARK